MSKAETILVPIDFSVHSRAATERACAMAEARGTRIRLLHALDLPSATLDYSFSESVWADLRLSEQTLLEDARRVVSERGIDVSACFEERDPADAIRSAARAADVGLIVMGSHGRRGIDRLLLGSVSERTLHEAPVPVLIVREDEEGAAERIRSILFATDFSEDSERAEKILTEWARVLGAEVEVLHALRETTVLFAPYAVTSSSELEGEMREAASQRIYGVLDRLERAGISAKAKIIHGFASEEIIARAESTGVQLIAMGSRGYSGLQRFRLGSVVQRVLRHAPCSVLVAGPRQSDSNL